MLEEASDWSRPLSPSPRIDLYLSCGGDGVVRGGFGLSGTIGGKNLLGTGVGLVVEGKPEDGMNITPSSDALILLGKVFDGATKIRTLTTNLIFATRAAQKKLNRRLSHKLVIST